MINFQKYEKGAAQLNQAANSLWNKVTFISVSEVLTDELDLRAMDKLCWEMKDRSSAMRRDLSNEMNSMPEDEYFDKYEDLHNQTEDLFYTLDKKLDAIDVIITALREIQDKSEEDNFGSIFNDIQKINIDESYSFIRLNRFKR
jgi:hypothetical protein